MSMINPSVSEPYQLMPPLSEHEFAALKADIALHGVQVPIEVDEVGEIIDGHHRFKAAMALGMRMDMLPVVVRSGLSVTEKRQRSRSMNLQRRHLTSKQKRSLIEDELRDDDGQSNLSIAQRLGVSDVTVGAVRRKLGLANPHVVRPAATDESGRLVRDFAVVVKCQSDEEQRMLLEEFSVRGFKCRALSS